MYKDLSELYQLHPDGFVEAVEAQMRAARPIAEIREEALSTEARESYARARSLLHAPDLLKILVGVISALGYAGDPRPALIGFVCLVSRLLDTPLNIAYIAPSAAGKNAAAEVTLPMFPSEAFYLIRASSPLALVYNEEQFQHRIVILTEADSLPKDGPAASAIRSLMTDQEMSYEVVERGKNGKSHVRKIQKLGPSGLITTSTKPLGEQASTRMLRITIPDTPEQTQLVLRAQADRANEVQETPDLEAWVAAQRWLELAGERRVIVPFAHRLAELVPTNSVRMRRDFPQLLSVIKTIALLLQQLRERDSMGRIIATAEDYREAYWLLEEVFAVTVTEGLTPAVRQTVEAVDRLSRGDLPVSEKQLCDELGLSKSSINYRVRRAVEGGWLINLATQKGKTAQLLAGTPLPNGCPLPTVEELFVCEESLSNPSNHSNRTEQAATDQIEADGSNSDSNTAPTDGKPSGGFEPGSNEVPNTNHPGRFEGFESSEGVSSHTESRDEERQAELPWDRFLKEQEGDGPHPG